MGFIPTKTSVQARGPEGPQGDIPGATRASAGVMTADQVRMLETVFQWHQTVAGGGGVIEIITPAPAASPVGVAQLEAIRQGFGTVSQRVADLERAMAAPRPVEAVVPEGADVSERLAYAEQNIAANDHKIATVAAALDQIAALVEGALQRIEFVESHAVASVSVETREGKAA